MEKRNAGYSTKWSCSPGFSLRETAEYRVSSSPDTCSTAELLALLIGGSYARTSAEGIVDKFRSIHQIVAAPANELERYPGVGHQTALRIKASLELGKKLLAPVEPRPLIDCPQSAASVFSSVLAGKEYEILAEIILDTRNKVIDVVEITHGTLNSSAIRIADVFKPAIRVNGAAIIVGHNHPSLDTLPSPEDISFTRALVSAGKTMDMEVLDHIVYGAPGVFISMKERNLF